MGSPGAPFVIHANLDCEARWAGIALPESIQQRISLYGSLLTALAPAGAIVEIWAPAEVDAGRLVTVPGLAVPMMVRGTPSRADLAWADPEAKAANDRRLALSIAEQHGCALPGAKVIHAVDDIDLPGAWVCKAPWTAAGRDRCHGSGPPTAEQRTRLARLLAKFGGLVLEPWCDRILDAGVCATVATDGMVTAHPAHGLVTDVRGTFAGIDLAPPALEPSERDQLATLVAAAGAALARLGYAGPFAIDAFAYRDGEARRFHPICEINARFTFGWIARALAGRVGATRLGLGPAPERARMLILPGNDGVTAWCA